MTKRSYISIICAAILWGGISIFLKMLYASGMSRTDAMAVRFTFAALFISAYAVIFNRKAFKIKLKDIWCFIGSGVISLFSFTYCLFSSMNYAGVATASALEYTAPVFVMLMSVALFGERFTKNKIIAVILTIIGCALISGFSISSGIHPKGIIFGILSGIGYALYSIFGRFAINRGYSSITITLYTFILAAPPAILISNIGTISSAIVTPMGIIGTFGLSVICCVVPYVLYTLGLKGAENSRAVVLSALEPIVAGLLSFTLYHEPVTVSKVLGIILILSGIVILNNTSKFCIEKSKKM